MPIANYSDLQAEIITYSRRGDVTNAVAANMIQLAEARFNRTLRVGKMEKKATATITTEYAALPSDFLALRNIQVNSSPVRFLEYITPQQMDELGTLSGSTCYFTIIGSELQLKPAPSATSSLSAEIAYYQAIPALATASTNWLLTAHPDAYIYGSLLNLDLSLRSVDKELIAAWKRGYDETILEIRRQDSERRWGGGTLLMRSNLRNVV